MIDLHSHVLPAVDDGAQDLEQAVEMCRMAWEDGCEAMVATPHQRHPLWPNEDPEILRQAYEQLTASLPPGPKVLLGAEIRVDSEALIDEIARIPAAKVFPINDTRYLLLEFGRRGPGLEPEDILHEIVIQGYIPILAHPECIPWLAQDLERLERLLDLGCYAQITTSSLLGDFGNRPSDAAHRMVSRGLVHFIASDCHNLLERPPGLSEAFGYIADTWNEATAKALVSGNPKRVLLNEAMPAAVLT
jgi:protein-tyrosine phosphatase